MCPGRSIFGIHILLRSQSKCACWLRVIQDIACVSTQKLLDVLEAQRTLNGSMYFPLDSLAFRDVAKGPINLSVHITTINSSNIHHMPSEMFVLLSFKHLEFSQGLQNTTKVIVTF